MSDDKGKRRGPLLVPLGGPDRAPIPPRGPAHPLGDPPPPLRWEEDEVAARAAEAAAADPAFAPRAAAEAAARRRMVEIPWLVRWTA